MENLSIDVGTEIKWSHWSRCESSFSMLLVPHRPGVLALAEEVLDANGNGKRMLALFYVDEARDLSAAVSDLFSPRSPFREQLEERRCYARYAMISDPENRQAVADALRTWMATHAEAATGITTSARATAAQENNCDCDPADCTVPHHAQSRRALGAPQTQSREEKHGSGNRREIGRPAFPAGF